MNALFDQINSLLTTPPGNLVYLLVLAFSIAGALQTCYFRWSREGQIKERRASTALGIMLGAVGALFLIGILAASGIQSLRLVLPPLDRALTLGLVAGAIWIWAFPRPSHRPDQAVLVLAGVALVAALAELLLSGRAYDAATYNGSLSDILWQILTLGLLVLGAALLYVRRTEGFAIGLGFLAVTFLGHAIHLVLLEPGNYSASVRLAHMAAFPLLLTLAQRSATAIEPIAGMEEEGSQEVDRRSVATDPKAVHALLGMALEADPTRLRQSVARAVGHTMLADLCLLTLVGEDESTIDLAAGFDLIREDYLQPIQIAAADVPRLISAIRRGKPLRLSATGGAEDIVAIGRRLGLKEPAEWVSAPLGSRELGHRGAIILLSPYSGRAWSRDDQNLLVSMATSVSALLQRNQETRRDVEELSPLRETLSKKDDEVLGLERRNDELTLQLETLARETETAHAAKIEELRIAKDAAESQVLDLKSQLERVEPPATATDRGTEEQLRATLGDLARLQNQLALSRQRVQELEGGSPGERRKKEQAEVMASISQELRQPMSSIIGYTDLLLGESVGILGALQRKFIERIKASTARIGALINDLIQLTTLEVGLADMRPEAMDLNAIVDNALAYTSSQVREKKISIHLDLPRSVAQVNADREALQQILIHLLQNAGAASPMEGTITIRAQTTIDEGKPYVMIQVSDTGGGIPEDDLPRVFTRLYRADNVLIQGVGDTGVGLSIAKTLVEAQHGRIWVESHAGAGATFCVLLPAVEAAVGRMPDAENR